MKLSSLIKGLFEQSKFTSPNSLAQYLGQTQPFTQSFLDGTKGAREKEDLIFEQLTKGVTADEFIAALKLVKVVRQMQIEEEQFL